MSVILTKNNEQKFKLIFETSSKEVICHVLAPQASNLDQGSQVLGYGEFSKLYLGQKAAVESNTPEVPVFVKNVPGEKETFQFLGTASLGSSLQSYHFKDYSYFELIVRDGKLTPWRNRYFYESEQAIRDVHARRVIRASLNEMKVASVLIPFLGQDISSYPMEVMSAYQPIFVGNKKKVTKVYEFADSGQIDLHRDFFWKVQGKSATRVTANSTTSVPVQLVWQKDGKACQQAVELTVACESGYIPVRRVKFNKDGQGTLQFHALGLPSGHRSEIKFFAHDSVDVGTVSLEIT